MNIRTILDKKTGHYSEKPAIIFKGEEISFLQLKKRVYALANGLRTIGVQKGDKIAIYLSNVPEYITSYLATYCLGAVAVPLDFMLTQTELINFINHSDAKLLIVLKKKDINLNQIKDACSSLQKMIVFGESEKWQEIQGFSSKWNEIMENAEELDEVDIQDNDEASIFYTSGSTGHPKGVLLNYGHFDNPVNCINANLGVTDQDSYLCAGVPFSHLGGLDYMLFMLYFGSTLILMERFHPVESLKNIQAYKPTVFCVVPAMFVAILSLKACEKFDLSSLIHPVVFGAPSSPVLLKRFQKLCPNAVLRNGWGMTETSAPNSYSPANIEQIHSIGDFKGGGVEAKVVNEDGKTCSALEEGELLLKGKALMNCYYKEPELTQAAFTEDGWFKTGDVVKYDENGLYYIVGRKKDMIKVAGEIVFANEVEEVLRRHPKVQDVAVIGVSDCLRGEIVKAYVACKENEDLTEGDLKNFAKEKMASFKVPHSIEFKKDLPRNRTGKIDKESLKQEILSIN